MAWAMDPMHSLIEFSVKHMMVTTVKGRFAKFTGDFDLNEENPAASKIDVTIDLASITTGDDNRDNHLRSPDFFDVATYPTATFKSTRIEKTGDDKFRVYGDLTLHGVTREVPLDVTYEGQTKNMHGTRLVAFSANTTFNRKDFGLNWNVALETGGMLVSENVKISIDTEVLEKQVAEATA